VKITVITISYNSRRYLAECMDSVLSQEYPELEYILVDGGSTDGTADLIRERAGKDSRIRWISEPDEGIADAFNKGLALATGELVGILNSDDTYAPDALGRVAEAYSLHPECDVFYGDMCRFEGERELFVVKPVAPGPAIWHEMPLNHPATFVTRRAYEAVGRFDADLRVAMDYDLVLRLYLNGFRFHYLPHVLARMRYGGASDERFLQTLREVSAIAVNHGYPRWRAFGWLCWRAVKSMGKMGLRRFGLHGSFRLHPRFRGTERG